MNASTQAISVSMVRKIANVSTIVQTHFSPVLTDFSPWLLDEETQRQYDPDSIDMSFSFSTWQPHLSCRCLLLQIHFVDGKIQSPKRSLSKIELTGHDYRGQHWHFSTQEADQPFSGPHMPSLIKQQQVKSIVTQLFTLFGCPASLLL